MNSKKLAILSLVAAIAFGVLSGAASATTRTVNPAGGADFTTIAAAVAASAPGDTIQCAAGIYPSAGNTGVTLDKRITLLGAQAGVDGRTRGPGGIVGAETVMPTTTGPVVFYLNSSDITIDGFDFQNMGPRGFDSYTNPGNTDNLTVRNNIFKSTTGNYSGGNIQLTPDSGGRADNFLFEQNYVQNLNGNMIYMTEPMDNGTIRNNYINPDQFTFGPFGPRTGWVIEGNEFNGDVPGFGPYFGYGMNANLGDVIIRNNNVHKMVDGVGQISVVGGSITGNTFDDNLYAGFQLWGGEFGTVVSTNVLIAHNLIRYNGVCDGLGNASHGIRLRPGLIDASTIHLHKNSFVDLGVGPCGPAWAIRQNGSGAADAELNWWNTAGPAAAIATKFGEGAVDFTPWISAYIDDPAHSGQLGFWPLVTTNTTIDSDIPDPTTVGSPYTVSGTVEVTGLGGVTINFASLPGQVVVSDGTDTCTDTTLTDSGTLNKYAFSCVLTSTTNGPKTLTATYSDTSADPFYNTSFGTAAHNVQLTTTISINNIPVGATFGGSFTPTYAYIGDGTPSVTSSTPIECTVSGGIVSFVGVGMCTLTAHATAGTNYAATDGSAQSFAIGQATTTISINNIPGGALIGGSFTPTYTYTGDGTTSVTSSTPGTCTVSGGLVNFVGLGICTLTAHATAGINYAAVDGSAQSFTIGPSTKKDCHKVVEQLEKDFNDQQKAADKAFDDNQKAAKKAFDATHPTAAQKKAFDDAQKAARKTFDDAQKAAKDAFQVQYKAMEQQCNQLPK